MLAGDNADSMQGAVRLPVLADTTWCSTKQQKKQTILCNFDIEQIPYYQTIWQRT
jgi:hypothetical protein